MPLIPAPLNTSRRRRSSKGTAGATIKRSASSPNVRSLAAGDIAMSLAEKRRNKLGYHRTSVACVHCRRRKIRCLLAPDDPQNRCSNCIRLKKECNFFPVDQQPPIERRPRAGSRTEGRSDENSVSSSSSPGLIVGRGMESVDHFSQYPMLPITSHVYTGSLAPMSAGIISPPSSIGPGSSRAYEFPPHHDRTNWENQLHEHIPLSAGHSYAEDHMSGHWRESPITPVYSPYTPGPPNSLAPQVRDGSGTFAPFGAPRHEPGWAAPTRSMSYGHVEDLSNHHLNHYQPPYQMDLRRRASEMHPPSLQTSNSSNASTSDLPGPPMSVPMSSQVVHQHGLPAAWSSLPTQSPMHKLADYGNWYSEPTQLARVQEEDVASHYNGEPPILYSSAGHH
ncbi:hypothetical protein MMC18_000264 [Xylographa bjoerkii]|nr:hypothetical protein [Xylographa bjoerkii]